MQGWLNVLMLKEQQKNKKTKEGTLFRVLGVHLTVAALFVSLVWMSLAYRDPLSVFLAAALGVCNRAWSIERAVTAGATRVMKHALHHFLENEGEGTVLLGEEEGAINMGRGKPAVRLKMVLLRRQELWCLVWKHNLFAMNACCRSHMSADCDSTLKMFRLPVCQRSESRSVCPVTTPACRGRYCSCIYSGNCCLICAVKQLIVSKIQHSFSWILSFWSTSLLFLKYLIKRQNFFKCQDKACRNTASLRGQTNLKYV